MQFACQSSADLRWWNLLKIKANLIYTHVFVTCCPISFREMIEHMLAQILHYFFKLCTARGHGEWMNPVKTSRSCLEHASVLLSVLQKNALPCGGLVFLGIEIKLNNLDFLCLGEMQTLKFKDIDSYAGIIIVPSINKNTLSFYITLDKYNTILPHFSSFFIKCTFLVLVNNSSYWKFTGCTIEKSCRLDIFQNAYL